MFDIGVFELVIIFVIALLVVGPEELPKLVRKIGYFIGQAKGVIRSARSTLDDQMHDLELKQMIAKRDEEIQNLKKSLTDLNPMDDIKKEFIAEERAQDTHKENQDDVKDEISHER